METNNGIIKELLNEREKQDEKFGIQNHIDSKWIAILGEEFGEICKAYTENLLIREEILQSAAVCVAWLEAIDRRI